MAVEISTKKYEILVRVHPDGKIGALLRNITVVMDGEVPVSQPVISDPVELSMDEFKEYVAGLDPSEWFQAEN